MQQFHCALDYLGLSENTDMRQTNYQIIPQNNRCCIQVQDDFVQTRSSKKSNNNRPNFIASIDKRLRPINFA